MKIIFFITIIFVFSFVNLFSTESDTLRKFKKYHTTVYVFAGSGFVMNSQKFFEIYNNVLGGKINEFKLIPMFGIGTKVLFTPELRFGISVDIIQNRINEGIIVFVKENDDAGYRAMGEDFDFRQMPVIITAEYIPYSPWQFKTYVGGGLGLNICTTRWTEQINSQIINDKRISGVQYNNTDLLPALKIYTGLELGFDRMSYLNFLGSLIIQFSYNHFFGGLDLFENIRKQYNTVPDLLNGTLTPIQDYMTLGVAVSFNFNRKYK